MEEQEQGSMNPDEVNEMMQDISYGTRYVHSPGDTRLTSIANNMFAIIQHIRDIQNQEHKLLNAFLDIEALDLEPLAVCEKSPVSLKDLDDIVSALQQIKDDQQAIFEALQQSIG